MKSHPPDEGSISTCRSRLSGLNDASVDAAETPGSVIKVLIADDHPIVRRGLRHCINDYLGMEVVGEAGTAQEVFDFLGQSKCDVLVLDIGLPDNSGLAVLRILKKAHPALPVLILSMYPEDQYSPYCLRTGAAGYLNKANAANYLVDAILEVCRGSFPGMKTAVAQAKTGTDFSGAAVSPNKALSKVEFQIFCQVAAGKPRLAIAMELGLSLGQVSAHCARILKVMRLSSNAEIDSYALPQYLFL